MAVREQVPHDIMYGIFLTLPVKTLIRFQCVCKPWLNLITSRDFTLTQFNHPHRYGNDRVDSASICRLGLIQDTVIVIPDPGLHKPSHYKHKLFAIGGGGCEEKAFEHAIDLGFPGKFSDCAKTYFTIKSSCHGMLCLANRRGDYIFLWNPSTRQHRRLPRPKDLYDDDDPELKLALGYDSRADDYKLVYIPDNFDKQVQVLSLKSNLWRRIRGRPPNSSTNIAPMGGTGVDIGGIIYWVATLETVVKDDYYNRAFNFCSYIILCFNLEQEIFYESDIPEKDDAIMPSQLGLWRGLLSLWLGPSFWVRKEENVNVSCAEGINVWSKVLTICSEISSVGASYTPYDIMRPLCFTGTGKIFVFLIAENGFGLYDPEEKTCKKLDIHGFDLQGDVGQVFVHTESLVSLNSIGLQTEQVIRPKEHIKQRRDISKWAVLSGVDD